MWRKYSRLLFRFATVSFRDMSEFRLDFFTSIVHSLIYQGIFFVFWKSVLSFTASSLSDWSFPDLFILSTFTLVSTAVMQWFVGLLQLPAKVLQGGLDKYLAKPVSPLFALLAEDMNGVASLQQMASALLILAVVSIYYHVRVTLVSVCASLGLMVLGCLVVLLVQGCLAMLTFWWGDVSRLQSLFGLTGEFERYPLTLFPLALRNFLIWIVPIGLISTYPVLVYLGRVEALSRYLAIAAGLAAFWGLVFFLGWRRAIARYESFGG
jgi:viologen exporter family transport system permease protein